MSIGISFFYHPKRTYSYHHSGTWDNFEDVETVEGNAMEFVTKFGGSIKYLNSADFKSARIECSFGGMKVYFDNAVIQNGSAVVNLDVSFAGVELFVPKSWEVVDRTDAMMGGLEEKNRNNANGDIKLILTGSCKDGEKVDRILEEGAMKRNTADNRLRFLTRSEAASYLDWLLPAWAVCGQEVEMLTAADLLLQGLSSRLDSVRRALGR